MGKNTRPYDAARKFCGMIYNTCFRDLAHGTMTQRKIIFLHIPKTGGTSIEHLLKIFKTTSHNARHYNIRRIQKHYDIPDITSYQIFAVIRNPFDRIVSTWRHQHHHWTMENSLSFPEYVDNIQRYFNDELTIQMDENLPFFQRAMDKNNKKLLHVAHIEKFNWWRTMEDHTLADIDTLRFEYLDQDWNKYKSTLGIKKKLPHLNSGALKRVMPLAHTVGANRDYMSVYDSKAYDIISNIYKDELKLFGYV